MRWKESSAIIIYDRSTLLYDLQTQNQRTHWNKTVQNHGFLWGQFARDLQNIFIQYIFKSLGMIVADCRSELRYAPTENCLQRPL